MSKQNSIELISVALGAGESRIFALSGEYFEVIDAPNPIDVVLSDFNGSQKARMNQASAAFYSKGVAYGVIQITSATAQTVRFAYGSGETGTRRATGSVAVSGPVNARPETPTATFLATGTLAALTPTTIVAPGSNLNGILVLNANISWLDTSGFTHVAAFLSRTSPPSAFTPDMSIILLAPTKLIFSVSLSLGDASLNIPQLIPAGEGLYFMDSNAQAAGATNMRSIRYRIL